MRLLSVAFAVVAVAGCPNPAPPTPQMPWLSGFSAAAVTDSSSIRVRDRMMQWAPCSGPCGDGMEVVDGERTVLASYVQGVLVLDRGGNVIARAPGVEI